MAGRFYARFKPEVRVLCVQCVAQQVPWVGLHVMSSGGGVGEKLALLAGGALALALVQLLQANLKRNSNDRQRTTAHNGKVDMLSH